SPRRAPPTTSRLPFPVTASFAKTVHFRAMPGGLNASALCLTGKLSKKLIHAVFNPPRADRSTWLMHDLLGLIAPWHSPKENMAEGAVLLRGVALPLDQKLLAALGDITAVSPFRHMV